MFCPKCGNPVPDDASFCGNCGTKLEARAGFVSEQNRIATAQDISVAHNASVARYDISNYRAANNTFEDASNAAPYKISIWKVSVACLVGVLLCACGASLLWSQIDQGEERVEAERIADEGRARARAEEVAHQQEEREIAQRSILTGRFGGAGMSAPMGIVSLSTSGNTLIVEGVLYRCSDGSFDVSLGDGEWRFILTENTTYGYYADGRRYVSRNEFMSEWLPSRFPSVNIEVDDGYVTDIWISA